MHPLLLLQVSGLKEQVDAVHQIGLGNTIALICVSALVVWTAYQQYQQNQAIREMSKGYIDGAVAQGKLFLGQEHIEGKLDLILNRQTADGSKLDRLLDRRS